MKNPNKFVIRNGIDTSKFNSIKKVPHSLLSKYKELQTSIKIILYVGRIEPRKSLETLILAYSMLPPKLKKETALVIVGSVQMCPGYYLSLLKLIQEKSLLNRVKFIGSVNYDQLPYFYSLADLIIFTSDYRYHRYR